MLVFSDTQDIQDLTGITDVSYGSLEAMGGKSSVAEVWVLEAKKKKKRKKDVIL